MCVYTITPTVLTTPFFSMTYTHTRAEAKATLPRLDISDIDTNSRELPIDVLQVSLCMR